MATGFSTGGAVPRSPLEAVAAPGPHGQRTLLGQTATGPGTVDASVTPGGGFRYVQAGGNGIADEFAVTGTTLTQIGSVTVPGAAGGEGIAAA